MRYLSVIGARPQYLKILDLPDHAIVDTGQHYDKNMSDVFIKQQKLKIKYHLKKTDFDGMVSAIQKIIKKENPEIVIVYGDTRSTLAGSIAAKFEKKVLAHVEAGMRSFDMFQPEEMNRIIADRLADYKFCVGEHTLKNLLNESLGNNAYVVGDPLWDTLGKMWPVKKRKDYHKFNLLTIHRPYNTESKESMENIFWAVGESRIKTYFPCHPRTLKAIKKYKIKLPENIILMPPQDYKSIVELEGNADKIITDSGGIQREAYWFACPCIVLRWTTEWQELVDDGWAKLVGDNRNLILDAILNFRPRPGVNVRHYVPALGAKKRIAEYLK